MSTAFGAEPTSAVPTPSPNPIPNPPPERALPAPVVSYTIEARLDAAEHRVEGKEHVVFRNASKAPLRELYFHLYLNAFKNEKSAFLHSPFGGGRSSAHGDSWGYIDVKHCTAPELGPGDLWKAHANGSPSEPDDETDVRLPLPRALEPGESVTLELEFSAKLPSVVLRTGYVDDFHLVGQWFPKLAKLSADGTFAHFPFHAQAEFYADFGEYDVTLDVPASMVVGATGERVRSEPRGERRHERYVAHGVHDFAWTAWPLFRERTARIDGVAVRVLYPPDQDTSAELTLAALEKGLPRGSALYGRYPYPTLTVVHPPERAGEAGGMEYPTLITTGGPWYAAWSGARAVESVTIHELLHQWFYGLVATNEERSPFLDEGLTSYAELRTLDVGWGPSSAYGRFGLELSATSLGRSFAASRAEDLPVSSAAADFPSFRVLGALVYSRTATILDTLARVYGRERFEATLGAYARRYRFEHPTPAEFAAAIGEGLGDDARRTLVEALDARGRVNFLVHELASTPVRPPAGVFDRASGRETVAAPSAPGTRHRGRAVVYRHGSLELPVDIDIVDQRGNRRRERWDGHGPFHVLEWESAEAPAYVVVDPEHRVTLDDDLLDNAASTSSAGTPRVLERATYFGALALSVVGP
ncbi:MAG TPA: M1 family metallopeptidase [Polyangiaceae bacterium]|nr:M1 family metallopeptidase [Polyangiaceae bacterium]